MDVVLLSRIQFALTIMFHYLFPPLTIGMGVVIVYLEARHYFTGDPIFHKAARFWTKLFGLNFAIGVATGIVMEFQFGTNWAGYSRFVGDVFGSALAAEGIFAFFLESGFLALLLFGWDKVSKGVHLFAAAMVSLGSIFSSVWIVVANSWQQTPAGHHMVPMMRDGQPVRQGLEVLKRAEIVDFWQLVFNPSSLQRLSHVLTGCFIMGAFFILSISAFYILKNRHLEFARRSFRGALIFGTVFSVYALIDGHRNAQMVYRVQPAKLASAEGHMATGRGDLTLFGVPSLDGEQVLLPVKAPGMLSLLLHGDFSSEVVGLDKFRKEDRPPLLVPFVSWRLMVGLGSFFIAITLLASFYLWRGVLFEKRWLLWIFVFAVAGPVVANQAGWVLAEVGRQPWVVHPPIVWNADGTIKTGPDAKVSYDESQGLRTERGVSTNVSPNEVITSIVGFSLVYLMLLGLWVFVLDKKIKEGPDAPDEDAGHRPEVAEEVAAHIGGGHY